MNDWFSQIPLNFWTLLFVQFLPFLFFGYHLRFGNQPHIIKKANALFSLAAVLLGVLVICRMYFLLTSEHSSSYAVIVNPILHLLPLICALILAHTSRTLYGHRSKKKQGEGGEGKETERPGFIPQPINHSVETIGWDEVIIDDSVKVELLSVISLLKDPKVAQKYGIEVPKGILFSGPPGTGKTTLAKVIASNARMAFFTLRSDEIVSKWVGESEKNLTKLFEQAKRHTPAVIFIDEVDSIGATRQGSDTHQWQEHLLNHLLQLIDGVIKTEGIYVVAATNRPELVDSALKRSGRLNRVIEVPLPGYEARVKLFQLYLARLQLGQAIDLAVLAQLTSGKSCADIKEICNQAALNAFKRETAGGKREYTISNYDLALALEAFGANRIQ